MCSRDDSVLFVQWTSVCHHSMLWFTASYADDTQLYIAIEKKDYVFNKESYMERCIAEFKLRLEPKHNTNYFAGVNIEIGGASVGTIFLRVSTCFNNLPN